MASQKFVFVNQPDIQGSGDTSQTRSSKSVIPCHVQARRRVTEKRTALREWTGKPASADGNIYRVLSFGRRNDILCGNASDPSHRTVTGPDGILLASLRYGLVHVESTIFLAVASAIKSTKPDHDMAMAQDTLARIDECVTDPMFEHVTFAFGSSQIGWISGGT